MPLIKTSAGERFYVDKHVADAETLPLILVHGAATSHLSFPPELRHLHGRRVVALDLPAHGRSSGVGRDSILGYADSVRELMDMLGIERAYLAGHSMGGAIVQTMAMRFAERVAGMILISTSTSLKVNPALLEAAQTDIDKVATLLTKWWWGSTASEEMKLMSLQQMLMTDLKVIEDDFRACDDFNLAGILPSISQPTLIVGGSEDKMVSAAQRQALHDHLPNSTLVQIEDAGHMLPLEKAAELTQVINDWLDQQTT